MRQCKVIVGEDPFLNFCERLGLFRPVPEYEFAPPRKFRCDYAWPEKKWAMEIEGGA